MNAAAATTAPTPPIERLAIPVSEADLRFLALLLIDAVESGAAVSFLAPLTIDRAEAGAGGWAWGGH